MCTPTVDFHHLDSCHAWHTKKSCQNGSWDLQEMDQLFKKKLLI
jgi:hypothetical protein